MSTKNYFRGNLLTNLDSTLTAEDLAKGLKLEEHTAVLDDYLSKQDGTYGFQGSMGRDGKITVPKQGFKGILSQAERVQRVRKRMETNKAPIPVMEDTTTGSMIFMEEDKECFEDGYICTNCYQFQAVPFAPECNWRNPGNDPRDKGCGFRRI